MNERVYIAAASTPTEIARYRHAAERLRAAGVEVVSTWPDVVEKVGAGNPRDALQTDRFMWSRNDLDELERATTLWLLCPPAGTTTRGAWVEVGFAFARKIMIVSSGDTKQTIFTALGLECQTDEVALLALGGAL